MPADRHPKTLTFSMFLAIYVGILVAAGIVLVVSSALWQVDREDAIAAYLAVVFALGAARRPEFLFQAMRSAGWFALIESDTLMQFLLGAVSLLMGGVVLGWWSIL